MKLLKNFLSSKPLIMNRIRFLAFDFFKMKIVPPENTIGLLSELYNAYQTSFIHIRRPDNSIERKLQIDHMQKKLKSILYSRMKINQRKTFNLNAEEKERLRIISGPKVLHILSIMEIGGSQKIILDMFKLMNSNIQMKILTGKIAANTYFPDFPITVLNVSKKIEEFIRNENPDIIHFHFWGMDPWMKMVLDTIIPIKQELNFKLIENCNNPIPIYHHSAIDYYIFVSQFVIDIQNIPLPKEKCHVVYPGVNTNEFFFSRSKKDNSSAGMVYRVTNDKINRDTIELLIKICKEIPNILIYVIGDGPNLAHFIRRSLKESVRNQICFTGFISFDLLSEYYDTFRIYIAPVLHESYGVVVPYAMAKGNPIVANRVDCLEELLGSNEMLCNNEEEFIEKIKDILSSPNPIDKIIEDNRSRAENVFSISKMLRDYENIYFLLSKRC